MKHIIAIKTRLVKIDTANDARRVGATRPTAEDGRAVCPKPPRGKNESDRRSDHVRFPREAKLRVSFFTDLMKEPFVAFVKATKLSTDQKEIIAAEAEEVFDQIEHRELYSRAYFDYDNKKVKREPNPIEDTVEKINSKLTRIIHKVLCGFAYYTFNEQTFVKRAVGVKKFPNGMIGNKYEIVRSHTEKHKVLLPISYVKDCGSVVAAYEKFVEEWNTNYVN